MGGEGPEMSMGKLLSLAGRGGFMGQLLVFGVFLFFFFYIYNASRDGFYCVPSFEKRALTG